MQNFVNLTPHAIVVRTDAGDVTLAPSGSVARVGAEPGGMIDTVGGIPLWEGSTMGAVDGLPAAVDGTLYVVSGMVAGAVGRTRDDVFAPGTGPSDGAVRDGSGRIVAVTRLVRSW